MNSVLVQSVQTPALIHRARPHQANNNTQLMPEQALTLLNSLPFMIYLVDWPKRQVIYSNLDAETCFARFQNSGSPLSLNVVEEQIHRADRQAYHQLLAQLDQSEERTIPKAELRLRGQRRQWQWSLCQAAPLNDVPHVLFSFEDITPHKLLEEQLREQCYRDGLTGLYNRTYFEAAMTRLGTSRVRPIGLLVMDMDNLKQVNDQNGHQAGDELLRGLAHCLKSAFRRRDVVARIGGDEFAVLLPRSDQRTLKNIVKRVTSVLDEHNAAHPDWELRVSIGAAVGQYGEPLSNVFHQADEAMYREKQWRKDHGMYRYRKPCGQKQVD